MTVLEVIGLLGTIIYYIAVIICFTILSIIFSNIWLMLLALLFLNISIKVKTKENENKDD